MSYQHCVVWLDHQHATVIDFTFEDEHVRQVEREGGHRKVHHKAGGTGAKEKDDHHFFDEVVATVGDAREILVVGPGNAKVAFQHDLQHRHRQVADRVVGVETVDHPTDGQLLAHARTYFKKVDALRGDA
jgi:stalled ribosome rescue protein Dom34